MSYNAREIGLVCSVLNDELAGTIVRKAISPRQGNRLCLELRAPGENHYLQICVAAPFCTIGRLAHKPKSQNIPSSFVMLLRKYVLNCFVVKILQLNDDRVAAIRLKRKNESFTLLAELSGRHGNLFLLDCENRILGTYLPNRSRKRSLETGEYYQLPLNPPNSKLQQCRVVLGTAADRQLMALYEQKETMYLLEQKRVAANRAITSLLKKQNTLVQNLQTDQQNAARGEIMKNHAFVLQANLHQIARGSVRFEGNDFENNPVSIVLNPKLSAVENMQTMFDKAGRLLRASDQIDERLLQAMLRRDHLVSLKNCVAQANAVELENLMSSLRMINVQAVERAVERQKAFVRVPYKQFSIFGSHTARVGKNAKDNDTLTLRYANPEDLWLHVRGMTGSHVVVPLGRGEEPSQDVLIDAAHLAVHFSSARGDDHVEITYTKRKYVQKPKGFAVGAVRLLREKTFILRVDAARLQKILSSTSK